MQKMGLITLKVGVEEAHTVADDELKTDSSLDKFGDVFRGLGEFKRLARLDLVPSIEPRHHPQRGTPANVREPLINQTKELERMNVIKRVITPTDWCSRSGRRSQGKWKDTDNTRYPVLSVRQRFSNIFRSWQKPASSPCWTLRTDFIR